MIALDGKLAIMSDDTIKFTCLHYKMRVYLWPSVCISERGKGLDASDS